MKIKAPEGCGAVTHAGRTLTIETDGSLEVEEDEASALAPHGFVPWRDEAPLDINAMSRDQLIMRVMDMTLKTLEATDTGVIRSRLVAALQDSFALPDEREGLGVSIAAGSLERDDIGKLNRPALFALLRAKGVSVSLPITNEELREAARRVTAA
jgi:hypothetical protein